MKFTSRVLILLTLAMVAACQASESLRPDEAAARNGGAPVLESLTLVPGEVVDPGRGVLYSMRAAGGIEALDIAAGSVRWVSGRADQPLFAADGVLAAAVASNSNGLMAVLLDPVTGEPVAENGAPVLLPLPAGVVAVIDQTLERSFRHSVLELGGEIFLTWEYIERDVTGVSPPDGRPFARRETGAFRFRDRTFEAVMPDSIPAPDGNWPEEVRQYLESQRVRKQPWHSGKVLAVTQQHYGPDELVLSRWRANTGEALEKTVLYTGRAIAVLASCDEQYAAVAVTNDSAAADTSYVLRFHRLDSGALLAQIPSDRSVGPFCLLDSNLLRLSQPSLQRIDGVMVEFPLELVSQDIRSGTGVWRRAFRDTTFRGLAPPRN